jgi:hypothetical protein
MRRRGMAVVVIALAGTLGVNAGSAMGEPNENASCVAEFGALLRDFQGTEFGQAVAAEARSGEERGIRAGEGARRRCGENPKKG